MTLISGRRLTAGQVTQAMTNSPGPRGSRDAQQFLTVALATTAGIEFGCWESILPMPEPLPTNKRSACRPDQFSLLHPRWTHATRLTPGLRIQILILRMLEPGDILPIKRMPKSDISIIKSNPCQ